jgi:prepilin-type processing-associated H-X9-DG protein
MSERSIARARGETKLSSLRILVTVLVILVVLFVYLTSIPPIPRERSVQIVCMTHLKSVAVSFQLYADDFDGCLPSTESWCDAIGKYISPGMLVCPGSNAKEGQSSYAMNEYLDGKKLDELPPDLVLLFDSKPGWNKAGGPEILTMENHKGKGCNVLFVDGHMKLIGADKISELKWTISESNSDK